MIRVTQSGALTLAKRKPKRRERPVIDSSIKSGIITAGGNTATVPEAFKKDLIFTLIRWVVHMK